MTAFSPPADLRLPASTVGMRIGILGGSFDPPHAGHLAVSQVALSALGLHQVWWLVSPKNPLKPNPPSHDFGRRMKAARAVAADPRIKVTGIEATLGTEYTAETLRRLWPRLAALRCVWLMGADNLAGFHRWRNWRSIAAALPIAVFNRPDFALPALSGPAATALRAARLDASDARLLPLRRPPAWVFLPSPHVPTSSTALRTAGGSRNGLS